VKLQKPHEVKSDPDTSGGNCRRNMFFEEREANEEYAKKNQRLVALIFLIRIRILIVRNIFFPDQRYTGVQYVVSFPKNFFTGF
jgi:hypothetical protein